VANVPEVGNVTDVVFVIVNVESNAPDVVKLPPRVIVLLVLATPVPPLAPGRMPVTPVVNGNPVQELKTPAVGVPSAGVVNDGEVAIATTVPEPLSVYSPRTP